MKKFENRYENKEFQKKPDNLVSTLLSIVRIVLLLAGIIGITYNLFKDRGWLSIGLTELTKSMPTFLIGGAILFVVIYFGDKFLSGNAKDGKATNKGDIALYLMMAAGVYFIFKYAIAST